MPAAKQEEERPGRDGSAASHLLAFALGAVSVGAALLVRALQKKLRKRRRVVRQSGERPRPAASRLGWRSAKGAPGYVTNLWICPRRAPTPALSSRHCRHLLPRLCSAIAPSADACCS